MAKRNVGSAERWISLAVGLTVVFVARRGGGPVAWATRAVGSALLARGASGRCEVYRALGIDTAREAPPTEVCRSITIGAEPAAILDHLADPQHLGALVPRVKSATSLEAGRWQITARGLDGAPVGIDLEVVREPSAIRWSAPDAPRPFEIVARVAAAPGGRGQELTLRVRLGPDGAVERAVARRLRKPVTMGLAQILRRVKAQLEAGAVAEAPRLERRGPQRVRSRRSVRRTA